MVSIQGFDPCCKGSNPFGFSNGVSSLSGKASHCEWEEQGSPDSYRDRSTPKKGTVAKMVNAAD